MNSVPGVMQLESNRASVGSSIPCATAYTNTTVNTSCDTVITLHKIPEPSLVSTCAGDTSAEVLVIHIFYCAWLKTQVETCVTGTCLDMSQAYYSFPIHQQMVHKLTLPYGITREFNYQTLERKAWCPKTQVRSLVSTCALKVPETCLRCL